MKLQRIAGDGSALVSVSSATDFTANGYAAVNLPPGSYRLVVATAVGVFANVRRVPGE